MDKIRALAKACGLQIFFGWLSEGETENVSVHWNQDLGGNWENFLECARALKASVLYLNWAPFEQSQVDDAVAALESDPLDERPDHEETNLLANLRAFESKVGLTCVIDVAFVANGIVHTHQEAADWFAEFEQLLPGEDEDGPE